MVPSFPHCVPSIFLLFQRAMFTLQPTMSLDFLQCRITSSLFSLNIRTEWNMNIHYSTNITLTSLARRHVKWRRHRFRIDGENHEVVHDNNNGNHEVEHGTSCLLPHIDWIHTKNFYSRDCAYQLNLNVGPCRGVTSLYSLWQRRRFRVEQLNCS